MEYQHTPVLLEETVQILGLKAGEHAIDGTLGGGGYSKAILDVVGAEGKVLSIDLDEKAIENYQNSLPAKYKDSVIVVHGNFANIAEISEKYGLKHIKGIVADIGLSSDQLDSSGRG